MTSKIFVNPLFLLNLFFLSLFFCIQVKAQDITIVDYPGMPEIYSTIPDKANETSGLIYFNDILWTFNDSGGKPELYGIDNVKGKISNYIILNDAENVDWEDITQDSKYIYVADFGNNRGNRKDLKIYKVDKKNLSSGNKKTETDVEIIRYKYSDQQSYESRNRNHNFDCESLISYGDSLILFSKNWVNGKTRLYKVPKSPGEYTINPIAFLNAEGLITGAAYDPQNKNLVFIGYTNSVPFIFFLNEFNGEDFHTAEVYRINFLKMKNSQTEGICWKSEDEIIVSTERTHEFTQSAYIINIKNIFDQAGIKYPE